MRRVSQTVDTTSMSNSRCKVKPDVLPQEQAMDWQISNQEIVPQMC